MAPAVRFPSVVGTDPEPGDDWQVVMFMHVPKTAGANLRHVFNRQYGLRDVFVPEPRVDKTKGGPFWRHLEDGEGLPGKGLAGWDPNNYQRRALALLGSERLASLKAVVGHYWFGLHESLLRPATYATMLRDPVDRALSVYFHRRHRYGLRLSLQEWVETARDFELDNAQTRRLCGPLPDVDIRFATCTPAMLEMAIDHLREWFSVVGLTERFDESFLLMARTLGWKDPWYERINVNRRRPRGPQVPTAISGAIREHNRYDAELYEFGRALFEEQLERLDPPIDQAMLRGIRRTSLVRRHVTLRRIYPIARPLLRKARSLKARVARILPHRGS